MVQKYDGIPSKEKMNKFAEIGMELFKEIMTLDDRAVGNKLRNLKGVFETHNPIFLTHL